MFYGGSSELLVSIAPDTDLGLGHCVFGRDYIATP
jgi:hypothetical protein